MKAALLVGIVAITTTLYAQNSSKSAQVSSNTATSATQPESAVQASSEVALSVELTRSLDARKTKPGDAVFAKCAQDLNVNGEILVPRNAKVVGHIVSAQTRGHGKPESALEIAFDKVILRDGREIPLNASVQTLAPPPIMAGEIGNDEMAVRNTPSPKPKTSGLLPGPIKTIAPETSLTARGSAIFPDASGTGGFKGLQLYAAPSTAAMTSVIHSSSQNVRLESGTRLILRVSLP